MISQYFHRHIFTGNYELNYIAFRPKRWRWRRRLTQNQRLRFSNKKRKYVIVSKNKWLNRSNTNGIRKIEIQSKSLEINSVGYCTIRCSAAAATTAALAPNNGMSRERKVCENSKHEFLRALYLVLVTICVSARKPNATMCVLCARVSVSY